jgi:recombination protein RecA
LLDKGTGEVYGHRTKFFTEKNKRAVPYRAAEVDLIYGIGYDTVGEIIDLGIDMGIIEQTGAWLAYETHKWQGKDKAKLALHADPVLREILESKIRAIVSGDVFEGPPQSAEAEERVLIDKEKVVNHGKPALKKRVAKSQASVS